MCKGRCRHNSTLEFLHVYLLDIIFLNIEINNSYSYSYMQKKPQHESMIAHDVST